MENALQGSKPLHRRVLVGESSLMPKKRRLSYTTEISLQVNPLSNTHDKSSPSAEFQGFPTLKQDEGDTSPMPFPPQRAISPSRPRNYVANTIGGAQEKKNVEKNLRLWKTVGAVARKEGEDDKLQLRQKERQAARVQIEKMEKTVEFNDYFYALLELRKMGSTVNTYGSLKDKEIVKKIVKWGSRGRFP